MADLMEMPPPAPAIPQARPPPQPQAANNQDYLSRNHAVEFRPHGTGLEDGHVILKLLPYLSYKDSMNCRTLCYNWNMAVIYRSQKFQLGTKGKMRDKWYTEVAEMDLNKTIAWNALEFHHFSFRRNSIVIRNYWRNTACRLKTLTMSRCSFECDGFIFLLDNCPVLETLNLKGCKLRDLDDLHNAARRPRLQLEVEPPALAVTQPIRHLSIDSMSRIECCFMDYLIDERTGALESINISKCFLPGTEPQTTAMTADRLRRYLEFERNLLRLIHQNRNTLQKFEFHENNFQEDFFGRLADRGTTITIPNFCLTLPLRDDSRQYPNLIRFMNNVEGLDKLTLGFVGNIQSIPLQNILSNHRQTLQKLKLIIYGNRVGSGEAFHLNFLDQFTALESLNIEDAKAFVLSKIRPFIGGRRIARKRLRRWIPQPTVDIQARVREVQTHLETEFVENLPNSLRKLTINKYMAPTDFIQTLPTKPGVLESFRLLTKLEIYGPWLYGMTGVIGTISQELRNLETLAMTACGIEDSNMTDLNDKAVKEMRGCLTYGLALFVPGASPSKDAVAQAVEGSMRADIQGPRRRLSDLPNLRHLDLSKNYHLSDVSIFDALRMVQLKTLILDGCNRITDAGLEFIGLNCPLIEEVNLKNCRKLSKYGLNRLVTSCRKLKKLFTTQIIQTREIEGYQIPMNPNYNDIVSVATDPQTEGFEEEI